MLCQEGLIPTTTQAFGSWGGGSCAHNYHMVKGKKGE